MNWISIKDRLPIPGEQVLFSDGRFVGEGYMDRNEEWYRYYGGKAFDILEIRTTHWMPLPEPPEIGGDEND